MATNQRISTMTIKVFKISDYEYWAGERFDACLKEAIDQTGDTEGYYSEALPLDDHDLENIKVLDEDTGIKRNLKCELEIMIEMGAMFPSIICCEE